MTCLVYLLPLPQRTVYSVAMESLDIGESPIVGARVPRELKNWFDDYARRHGLNQSDALRKVLERTRDGETAVDSVTQIHTRTHTMITFANPFLVCEVCHRKATGWHDNDKCGCTMSYWLEPCGHKAGTITTCPSWSPDDGCVCAQVLGVAGHTAENK